ncbi:hypothetical protein F66182_2841 [Fusarium sp. NRRL 66182]|nr:hypothetical protein F66182_2841 [Fusarium sp. NRRL 66182]
MQAYDRSDRLEERPPTGNIEDVQKDNQDVLSVDGTHLLSPENHTMALIIGSNFKPLPLIDVNNPRNLQSDILPAPRAQISWLPPMAQYLFQFYLSETMRLTVPSSYAKNEICRFLVPMSFREPSLLYAVMAFAAVHLDAMGKLPGNSKRRIDSLHWTSIRSLRQLLNESDPVSQAVALATTRTLCQAQIYGGTSLWRVHLDGARAILESIQSMNQATNDGCRNSTNTEFLSSWFHNAEALAALSPTGLFSDQRQAKCQSDSGVFFDIYGGVMSDLPALFRAVGALVAKGRRRNCTTDVVHEAASLVQEIRLRITRDSVENLPLEPNILLSLPANDIHNYALSNSGFLYTALLHIYCGAQALSPLAFEVQFCVDQIIQLARNMSCEHGLSPKVLLVAPLFTAGLCAAGSARESIRDALEDIGEWMRTPHLSKTLALLERVWQQYPDGSQNAGAWEYFGES